MKYFIFVLIAVLVIFAAAAVILFLMMKRNGKCPLCAVKRIAVPRKITMDLSDMPNYDNGAAKTPPMGWSSWNTFRNHINQDIIIETADAMVNSGLADAGYKYLNLDDCWQSSQRDASGRLQGDLGTFSRGIPQLIKEINSRGLKAGLYSSNGTLTCEDMPASLGNEELDARTIAEWGCEFFKYDFCHKSRISGDCPAIERIELKKIEAEGDGADEILYPEDAEFSGRARVVKFRDLPSGKAIGFLNHGAGAAHFRKDLLNGGKYVLTAVFRKTRKKHESYMQITVNGRVYEMFFPCGKGFSDSGRSQITVELDNGENLITIQNPVATQADSSFIQYRRMGTALQNAVKERALSDGAPEKPIVYSICEWGTAHPWKWGAKAGNMWRTTHDIFPNWHSINWIYNSTVKHSKYSVPGGWNDPDMLEVGNGKLTEDENRAHFSLWCMMAAPLMLGNDVRKFVDGSGKADENNAVLKIVTNKELIAVDQDNLGKSAKRIKKLAGVDVLARPLSNGDTALCLYNKSPFSRNVRLELRELLSNAYLEMNPSEEYELRDLWSGENTVTSNVSARLPKHSVKVYRVRSKQQG